MTKEEFKFYQMEQWVIFLALLEIFYISDCEINFKGLDT